MVKQMFALQIILYLTSASCFCLDSALVSGLEIFVENPVLHSLDADSGCVSRIT